MGTGPATEIFGPDDGLGNPWGLMIDGGFIYWTDTHGALRAVLRGAVDGSGAPTVLYDDDDFPNAPPGFSGRPLGITVHDGNLFWVDDLLEQITSAPSDGDGPVSVVYDIGDYPGSPSSANPWGIAVAQPAAHPGDMDGDGDVDGRDFLVGQANGITVEMLADWETNFGTGATNSALVATPEPSGFSLLVIGCVAVMFRRPIQETPQ